MGEARGDAASSPSRPLVLVVEDQETVAFAVRAALEREGFSVRLETDGAGAMGVVALTRPALVVLDIGLPGVDGLSVLRELRRGSHVPVIMLTSRYEEIDRILGLELGADDYVVKPFSARELAVRVRTVLRRASPAPVAGLERMDGERMQFGELAIDTGAREVSLAGRPVELTRREFDVLLVMASAPRRVWSREQLLHAAWDSSGEWQDPATVTEHIRRLRLKIEVDLERPRWIQTVRGVGYRFVP